MQDMEKNTGIYGSDFGLKGQDEWCPKFNMQHIEYIKIYGSDSGSIETLSFSYENNLNITLRH